MNRNLFSRTGVVVAVTTLLAACSSSGDDFAATTQSASSSGHATIADVMPAHLGIMLSMAWFGIPTSGDLDGAGTDPGYGNWEIGTKCSAHGDADQCVDGQRNIASRYRPLAGIYSSAGRDDESLARIRLALSTLNRPCADDVGARLDSFAIQLDGTKYTSLHVASPKNSQEGPYQALIHTYEEADAAHLVNAVLPADDATWYFGNGQSSTFTCTSADHTDCYDAIEQDVIDMLTLSLAHESSLKIGGLPVLYYYFSTQLSPDEWNAIFTKARNTKINGSVHDFFVLGSSQSGSGGAYFKAFDGISPWINLSAWDATKGDDVRAHATAYAAAQHDELYKTVPAGKVVLGGVGPGFDDFTNGWNNCATRQIPRPNEATPRDPDVLDGEIDFLESKNTKFMIFQTWDDWTEGSFMEPSVSEGTSKIVQLQTRLGELYGEPAVSPTALENRWKSYGQPRGCGGAQPSPDVELCAKVASPTCAAPQILEPTANEDVGPAIRLRVSTPVCIDSATATIDGAAVKVTNTDPTIGEWVPVTKGTHTLRVSGTDKEGNAYTSPTISFTRTY
jgi:hypothetical protein